MGTTITLALLAAVALYRAPDCPSCGQHAWAKDDDLWTCERCGVLYDRSRGTWRYRLLTTLYPMPGLLDRLRYDPDGAASHPDLEPKIRRAA